MNFEFNDMDSLSPANFEVFIRDLFVASGWSDAVITEVGKEYKYGDGGVDIFAYKGKRKFAIEVKQRSLDTNVDVSALNQLVTGARLANVENKILVTNSYFTSEVKIRALRLGVELVDRDELKNLWVVRHSEIGRSIRPRKYQQQVIDTTLEQYRAGKKKILIEMATGLGKTYTVAHIVKNLIQEATYKPKVLFLAHQIEILLQSVTAFKNVLGMGNYSFSACFAGSTPENTDFIFATFDTLYGQLDKLKKEEFCFIIVDEAHHTPAKTYSEVVHHFKPKLLVGLTATPVRSDNKNVIDFFGGSDGHIGKFDLVWALKHRKLAFPKYLVLLDDLDQDKINQLESGLSICDLDKKLFLNKKDEEVVRIIEKTVIEEKIEKIKGMVFCRNIKHMNHLIGFFELGTATLVHSKMSSHERRENIRNFREGDYKYILVCDLFNEGIDIPETNLLVFMRNTGSRTIWLQQLGRGLRKTPNKEYVHVLDFVGSLERLNEIRELSKQVQRITLDPDSLIDCDDNKKIETFYDGTLEVRYTKAAARVLELLESFKMQLSSRESLIAKLYSFREKSGNIPSIDKLESDLDDVGVDQIATHFSSYFGYLCATFGSCPDEEGMLSELQIYIDWYRPTYGMNPSAKAVTLNFREQSLYKYTESDIKILIPDFEGYNSLDVCDVTLYEAEGNENTVEYSGKCEIVKRYRDKVKSRKDFNMLEEREKSAIKSVYQSTSVFLKKLRGF